MIHPKIAAVLNIPVVYAEALGSLSSHHAAPSPTPDYYNDVGKCVLSVSPVDCQCELILNVSVGMIGFPQCHLRLPFRVHAGGTSKPLVVSSVGR
jgi:hypothetical protein